MMSGLLGEFEKQFHKIFWCKELQNKVIQKSYDGKYREEDLSLIQCVMKLYYETKYLDTPIGMSDFVRFATFH